jgi:hypothetical protein
MKTKILVLALVLALSLVVTGVAAARVAVAKNGVERTRWMLSGGASDSAAGGAALRATLGQPVVGGISGGGGDVTLGQGFWHGATQGYSVYLPLVLRGAQ